MFIVSIRQGSETRRFTLGEAPIFLGAAPENDIQLDSDYVSRRHLELRAVGDQVEIRDAGSLNGVFVAGRRVRELSSSVPLRLSLGGRVDVDILPLEDDELALASQVRPAGRPSQEPQRELPSARSTRPGGAVGDEFASELLAVVARAEAPSATLVGLLEAARHATGLEAGVALRRGGDGRGDWLVSQARGEDALPSRDLLSALDERLEAGETLGWLKRAVDGREKHLGFVRAGSGADDTVLALIGEARLIKELAPLKSALQIAVDHAASAALSPREGPPPSHSFQLARAGKNLVESSSPAVKALHLGVSAALTSDLPVLLNGETGVGKEVYAQAIHEQSSRREGPMLSINSSAIPESLLEALLFGAAKGTATGVEARQGLLERADGGTFFLDEVGELTLSLQAKLLRVLDQGEVHPVGAPAPVPIDVRLISATNRDLLSEVDAGQFRKDLYFRLSGHRLEITALRDRRCDIPTLIDHFLQRECASSARHVAGVSIKAMRALVDHDWPGNVRELEMLIRRLVHSTPNGEALRFEALPEDIRTSASPGLREGSLDSETDSTLDARIDDFQHQLIGEVLSSCSGNRSAAAAQLGISRGRLRRLTQRLNLD